MSIVIDAAIERAISAPLHEILRFVAARAAEIDNTRGKPREKGLVTLGFINDFSDEEDDGGDDDDHDDDDDDDDDDEGRGKRREKEDEDEYEEDEET
ncbi:MAG: hypothetical protein SGPRY_005415 [Prymnesium sp.]